MVESIINRFNDMLGNINYQIQKLKVKKYRYNENEIKSKGFFSQEGQDLILSTYFGKKNGYFVDIGAYDGISFSNTYYFEKVLGWNGIAIEPNAEIYSKLTKNRTCECINACISDKDEVVEFLLIKGDSEMLSGIIDKYHPKHLRRIQREQLKFANKMEKIIVSCYTLQTLLNRRNIKEVDILSIDTEGGEFDIIDTFNFKEISINAVVIENPYSDWRIWHKLNNEGFIWLARTGGDEIYVNKN